MSGRRLAVVLLVLLVFAWVSNGVMQLLNAGKVPQVEAAAHTSPVVLEPGEVAYFLCVNSNHSIVPGNERNDVGIHCNPTAVSEEGKGRGIEDEHILLYPGQQRAVHCEGTYYEVDIFGLNSLGVECIE